MIVRILGGNAKAAKRIPNPFGRVQFFHHLLTVLDLLERELIMRGLILIATLVASVGSARAGHDHCVTGVQVVVPAIYVVERPSVCVKLKERFCVMKSRVKSCLSERRSPAFVTMEELRAIKHIRCKNAVIQRQKEEIEAQQRELERRKSVKGVVLVPFQYRTLKYKTLH